MTLNGSLFHNLVSLQTLKIVSSDVISLSNETFVGLSSLQELTIRNIYFNTIATSSSRLTSLRRLDVFIYIKSDYVTVKKLFGGLDNLEYLSLSVRGNPISSTFDICSLVSLNSLELFNSNINNNTECLKEIKLKALKYTYVGIPQIYPPYPLLPHLTNLTLYIFPDEPAAIKTLQSLNSPLQNLTIYFETGLTLNSTTFEPLAKQNESLRVLELHWLNDLTSPTIILQDSPFKWFPNVRNLLLHGLKASFEIHRNCFKGLKNLEELHLDHVNTDVFTSGALQIFSRYNNLKVLDFKSGKYIGGISGNQLCKISSSLQTIDLSYNKLQFPLFNFPCTLPDLKILIIDEQENYPFWHVQDMFELAPNLNEFYASNAGTVSTLACTVDTCRCMSLTVLDLSKTKISSLDKDVVYTPCLEKLLLSSAFLKNINMLRIFKSHHLKHLDLSKNHITFIEKEDTILIYNLTYLDLSNNKLTSIGNLQYFRNLQILNLENNQIVTVPKSILSKSKLQHLHILNLSQNPLVCDCNIEPLAKWLRTDKVVYLYFYYKNNKNYCCVLPDSRHGLSITEIDLDCKSHMWLNISVGITCFVILVIAAFLAVRYRWHIQYQLFLLFNRRRNYQNYLVNDDDADQDGDDEGGLPRYDAYVTYHREDEDWVDAELVANIEEGEEPFRLCLRTRDIRAGRLIFNELSLRIQRSRKVLVILSSRFVADNWCYFELNMAHHRVLEENRNVMIFIILEEIPNNKLTLLLRQLFCKVQVIKWPADEYGQNLFWRRLREELKRPVPLDRRFNI